MGKYDAEFSSVRLFLLIDGILAATDAQIILDLEASGLDVGHVFEKDGMRKSHEKHLKPIETDLAIGTVTTLSSPSDDASPTSEEMKSLRRVAGAVSWSGYMLCFVEAANNASYYGVTGVLANFLQRPLPEGGNGWVSIPFVFPGSVQSYLLMRSREHRPREHNSLLVLLALACKQRRLSLSFSRFLLTVRLS